MIASGHDVNFLLSFVYDLEHIVCDFVLTLCGPFYDCFSSFIPLTLPKGSSKCN